MYLEATGETFGDSLDLCRIAFANGRRADSFLPVLSSPDTLLERFNRRKRTVTGKWHVDDPKSSAELQNLHQGSR